MQQPRLLILAALSVAALARPAAADVHITGTFRYNKTATNVRSIANTEVDVLRFTPGNTGWQLLPPTTTNAAGAVDYTAPGSLPGSMYLLRIRMRNMAAGIFTAPWPTSDVAFAAPPWIRVAPIPVAADYDGDGTDDIAIWAPSTGLWRRLISGVDTAFMYWGGNGDIAVPAR